MYRIMFAVFVGLLLHAGLYAAERESDPRLQSNGAPWGLRPGQVIDPKLPHVLLIGDSIVGGYQKTVVAALRDKATVDVWVTPGSQASIGKKQITDIVTFAPYAVIHFNLGLHGWQKGRIPEGQFEPLTKALVQNIRAAAPQASLVWASTTPTCVKGKPTELNPEINPVILQHNAMAAKVMNEEHVPVNDLYTLSVAHMDLMNGDVAHWKGPGCELQGKQVVAYITDALDHRGAAPSASKTAESFVAGKDKPSGTISETSREIPLLPETAQPGSDQSSIKVFLPPPENRCGTAVIICPGGGYGGLSMKPEGTNVAEWLNRHGIAGIVLKYRLPKNPANGSQAPLDDAHAAIRTVRQHAREWGIDPKKVGIMGFSAGGHLASTAGTHFDAQTRPDFMMLVYPVITMGEFTHKGSKKNLLGENPGPERVNYFSNELQVTPDTPPTFLAHSADDKGTDPRNSIQFYLALLQANVPAEMVIYPDGNHGMKGGGKFGLGETGKTLSTTWPQRALEWLTDRGLCGSKPDQYPSE